MLKGGDELARNRVPKFCAAIRARGQNPSTVWTKRRVIDRVLMVEDCDEVARGRIPELSSFVRARRQNPSTVRTKRRVVDLILMVKGGDEFAGAGIPKLGGSVFACCRIRAPSGLNAATLTASW